MRSKAKRGQGSRMRQIGRNLYSDFWPLPGSKRGEQRRRAAEDAFLNASEQISLTNWQNHQWERACHKIPRRADGKPRKLPDRYPYSQMQRERA